MANITAALKNASTPPSRELFSTLISAGHILHYHNVLDAYGHVSVRNPQNPATFFLAKSLAPALVSTRDDIEEYYVSDATPVKDGGGPHFLERFIHSEIFKSYESVNSVVHSHSEDMLPFSISTVPLVPVYHMAGVMGARVPVYDIALHYKSSDEHHSLLVVNEHLGAALAAGFNPSSLTSKLYRYVTASDAQKISFPSCPTVLMRGHGFSCVGSSIEEAVNRAIFSVCNARVQKTAMLMQGSVNVSLMGERFAEKDGPAKQEGLKALNERECDDSWKAIGKTYGRAWKLWLAEVSNSTLYNNTLAAPQSE